MWNTALMLSPLFVSDRPAPHPSTMLSRSLSIAFNTSSASSSSATSSNALCSSSINFDSSPSSSPLSSSLAVSIDKVSASSTLISSSSFSLPSALRSSSSPSSAPNALSKLRKNTACRNTDIARLFSSCVFSAAVIACTFCMRLCATSAAINAAQTSFPSLSVSTTSEYRLLTIGRTRSALLIENRSERATRSIAAGAFPRSASTSITKVAPHAPPAAKRAPPTPTAASTPSATSLSARTTSL
mmetsp:Transcript_14773/g.39585  ORF Transcript_14773/g.39585 Transcript_14773/m.39585 type:complete len:243 (+) Transcript_14773:2262-2990(+)